MKKVTPLITVRPYERKDRQGVIEILYRTGYMGEDATSYFDDKYLFGLLFGFFYLDYEPDSCFVSIDHVTNELVGYILCSLNTRVQSRDFQKKMIPKILTRAFIYTSWRYRQSFRVLLYLRRLNQNNPVPPNENEILNEYPAHLHINVLPKYHRQGVGTKLIDKLEEYLENEKCIGIHLWTSERNKKAIQFYLKKEFKLLYTSPSGYGLWPSAKDVRSLVFGKKFA